MRHGARQKTKHMRLYIMMIIMLWALLVAGCKSATGDKPANSSSSTPVQPAASARLPIAYINTDTLLNQYTYYKLASQALADKEQKGNQRLESKLRKLQKEFAAVQDKIQKGELTANQIAEQQQRFAKKQQALEEERVRLQNEILKETQEVQDSLYAHLRRVLRQYADEHGYQYVLSYAEVGSPVLIAPKDGDVTADILEILNKDSGQ